MLTSNELIKINVFRPLDGLRAPYTISLDHLRNVVSDVLDEAELQRIKSNPYLLARHQIEKGPEAAAREHQSLLDSQGLHRHVTERGIVLSREPLDSWELNFDMWLDPDSPNPFENTEDLREEYFVERADVVSRIASGNCPGCELNRMQVGYRNRLRESISA